MDHYLLVIDQGTASSRAIVFNEQAQIKGIGRESVMQIYPNDGWVEHDGDEMWPHVLQTARQAIAEASLSATDISAIGISNQRETSLLWDRQSGEL